MRRKLLLSIALLVSAGAMAAQAFGQASSQEPAATPSGAATKTDFRVWQVYPACPVAMRATQGGGGGLLAVSPGKPAARQPTQSIRLILLQNKSSKVTKATVTVHGLAVNTRMLPAAGEGPAEISRSLHVDVEDGDAPDEGAADLVLAGFTSVRSIDLKSLTYADGSTWTSGEKVCRATPDLLMRVDAR